MCCSSVCRRLVLGFAICLSADFLGFLELLHCTSLVAAFSSAALSEIWSSTQISSIINDFFSHVHLSMMFRLAEPAIEIKNTTPFL